MTAVAALTAASCYSSAIWPHVGAGVYVELEGEIELNQSYLFLN